jgi:hypothetical protein
VLQSLPWIAPLPARILKQHLLTVQIRVVRGQQEQTRPPGDQAATLRELAPPEAPELETALPQPPAATTAAVEHPRHQHAQGRVTAPLRLNSRI